ncbi:MAG TPA: hypothetical protein VHS97_17590, partial [Isosphaeraceae bacterium]|nr:hypothetical protein [Isosphaeraceae bacterium]
MNARAITMTFNHIRIEWLIVAIMCAVGATGRLARAQDEDEPKPQVNAEPPRPVMVRDEDFDRWVFSLPGGKDAMRLRLETILTRRVARIAHQCALTEVQKKKLLLAGRGDIKRFFDRVEEMRAKFDRDADDRAELVQFRDEIRSLRVVSSEDLFGKGSIFSKVFKSTLTAHQSALYENVARDGAHSRHGTTIRWVVATLDTVLELSPVQHGQLEALLVEQTRPPRNFGEYDYYGVLFQVSKLPENRFKSILSDDQWAKLSKHIDASRRLLPKLKAGGFIPEDDVAAAPGSADHAASPQEKKRG